MSFKSIKRLSATILAFAMAASLTFPVMAAGPAQVTVAVSENGAYALAGAKKVGTNIEMSFTSDEMWAADGNWMEQTFAASGMKMMRWGYDAWAFDWETELPLSPNRYWGGLNTKDAAGTFGLREFIAFCKKHDIVPFVMIPIESLDTFGGQANIEKIKALTASMAQYINEQGIELCYFDMGNEPWNNGASGSSNASHLGGLFPAFSQIVKGANPNYRLVLQRAPQNILWNAWNNSMISATQGAFDAYDDHRYSFYGWNKYFDTNSDNILTPGTKIEGKEAIMGECNIGWTPTADNWDEGHVRDTGGGMALMNAMLNLIDRGDYSYIVSWPSHYPSKLSIAGCPNNAFGWFNLDEWYLNQKPVRLNGPILAHKIINDNVLDMRLPSTSTGEKVRTFAYANDAGTDLRVIVINKWDATTLTLQVPPQYNTVSAMKMKGTGVQDTAPQYTSHIDGNAPVADGTFVNDIPSEGVVVYNFSVDNAAQAPQSPTFTSPIADTTNGSTAQTFAWQPIADATNYRLIVSPNADLSAPAIDTYTGKATSYQSSACLQNATLYYASITAHNAFGVSGASNISFTTAAAPEISKIFTLNNNSPYITHSTNWNVQSSGGSYLNDDMACEQKDGYAEFTFTGTQAKIYGVKGDWCGMADVQIDFGAKNRIDSYSAQTTPQEVLFDTGDLPYGEHTITLTVAGEKSAAATGTWIEYDKVELFDSQNPQPITNKIIWNDENPNIKKFSAWKHQSVGGSYHDDDTASATWKASMEIPFSGTNAVIYGLKGPWCGKADITVDGTKVATIDTYAQQQTLQAVLFDTGTLANGAHTVKITVTASKSPASTGKWVEIDKIVMQ